MAALTGTSAPSWSVRLAFELTGNDQRAQALLAGLTEEHSIGNPRLALGGIGQCLEHLCLTNDAYMGAIAPALEGKTEVPVENIAPGWFSRWFIRTFVEASPNTKRAKAPGKIKPTQRVPLSILDRFLSANKACRELIVRARHKDVNRIRFWNPLYRASASRLAPRLSSFPVTNAVICCRPSASATPPASPANLLRSRRYKAAGEKHRSRLAASCRHPLLSLGARHTCLEFMATPISLQHAKTLAARRFFLLFLFLLASLIVYPYAENTRFGYYTFRVVASAAILFCVYAVSFQRGLLIAAMLMAIPAFLHRIFNVGVTADFLSLLNIVLSFSFDVFVVVIIFRRVFAPKRPNSETIFGALCIYLLIGFAFSSIYGMVAVIQPHAFYLDPLTNLHANPDRLDFVYLSFATMSTLGAAGITPVSGEARFICVIEAIIGVLYLAVLISRLVAAYRHPTA